MSPRGRRILVVVAALLVLAGLLFAADRGVQALAERRIATEVQSRIGASRPAAVHLGSFPFLTEIATGKVHTAQVHVDRLEIPNGNGAQATQVDATFSDIRLSDGFSTVTAAEGRATGTLDYENLSALTGLQVSYAESDRVAIDFSVPIGRLTVQGTATGRPVLDVDAQALTIEDAEVTVPGAEDDQGLVEAAGQLVLRRPYALGQLPYELKITELTVTESGLQFGASGQDLPLR